MMGQFSSRVSSQRSVQHRRDWENEQGEAVPPGSVLAPADTGQGTISARRSSPSLRWPVRVRDSP